ncbi:MAG: MlaD family protein [Solirubrobacteraceae bacterium]
MATFRTTRRTRRRAPRPATVVLAGVLTCVIIGAFIWLAENAYNGLPFLSYRTVYVSMPNIGHLKQHDPVDIAGVRVGQVLATSTRNNRALVKLQLQGVGPLPIDSKVVVRANGLLGARYVELDPGSSKQVLANGATLTESNAIHTYTWGLPEALNLFDSKTRAAFGYMLNGAGQGVEGRGLQLNQAIHVGPTSGANFDTTAYAILSRPGAAASFIPNTNSGVTALNSARDDLANMFHPAAVTSNAVAAERGPLQHLLSFAPAWEPDVVRFGPYATQVVNALSHLSSAGEAVLPSVPRALASATSLLRDTPAPLRATKQVFDQVPRAVPATLSILRSLKPDLTPLKNLFSDLAVPVVPLAQHGCDLQSFATNTRSMVNFGGTPGGHWGPDVGFPIGVISGPQQGNGILNTGYTFPIHSAYNPPCAFSPGATWDTSSFLKVLEGAFSTQ